MKINLPLALSVGVAVLAAAGAAFAGQTEVVIAPVGGPAPLLGAGLPGLAVLAVAGGGYVTMRFRRRR